MIVRRRPRFCLSVLLVFLIASILMPGLASASSDLEAAYRQASADAGNTTTILVESIDITEFENYFGLELTPDEEKLFRIVLMAYSNGAMLEHPAGLDNQILATVLEDPYVGNRNSHKFHYSWCSSVSDIKEKNKVTFVSREDAVEAGFEPCKRCNP